jgi:hypothetical protein
MEKVKTWIILARFGKRVEPFFFTKQEDAQKFYDKNEDLCDGMLMTTSSTKLLIDKKK